MRKEELLKNHLQLAYHLKKEIKLEFNLTPYTKINSQGIKKNQYEKWNPVSATRKCGDIFLQCLAPASVLVTIILLWAPITSLIDLQMLSYSVYVSVCVCV